MSDGSATIPPSSEGEADPGRPLSALSRLQNELRRRWSQGERVEIEEYLSGASAKLFEDPDRLLDFLYQEVLLREEFGEAPELAEYLRRFPQFAQQIRDLFEVHSAFTDTQWRTASGPSEPEPEVANATTLPSSPYGDLPAGRLIPGYELIRELGRGGMGVVYLARQAGLGRLAAVKMILAGSFSRPQDHARLRAEAEAVARLDHPNLVRIYEVGEWDGRPFLSMEYVDGRRLADSLQGTPMSPPRAAELGGDGGAPPAVRSRTGDRSIAT